MDRTFGNALLEIIGAATTAISLSICGGIAWTYLLPSLERSVRLTLESSRRLHKVWSGQAGKPKSVAGTRARRQEAA